MSVSITNIARGVKLARDSGVPLSDILENNNFTSLDVKDKAGVLREYAYSHDIEPKPLDSSARIKALVGKAAWGALAGATTGLPVAMVIKSGFLPLSTSPKALLSGAKLALADKSVRLGLGAMAGLGGAQGAYNAVRTLQARESDRKRVHEALQKIRSEDPNESESYAYGAMFGSVKHYDDPKPVKLVDPAVNLIGQLVKPYEKTINYVNAGRLGHEADSIDLENLQAKAEHDMRLLKRISDNVKSQIGPEDDVSKEMLDEIYRKAYNQHKTLTDEDMANVERGAEIAHKAKLLKDMIDQVNGSSILSESHEGLSESVGQVTKSETLNTIIDLIKPYYNPDK